MCERDRELERECMCQRKREREYERECMFEIERERERVCICGQGRQSKRESEKLFPVQMNKSQALWIYEVTANRPIDVSNLVSFSLFSSSVVLSKEFSPQQMFLSKNCFNKIFSDCIFVQQLMFEIQQHFNKYFQTSLLMSFDFQCTGL